MGKGAALVDLDDAGGDDIEEIAVVGDEDSASRWLVGSSSSSRSGWQASARQRATRRFSPPDSGPTAASSGGVPSAVEVALMRASRFQPSAWSMRWSRSESSASLPSPFS
jgi:hypothetical protein